MQEKIESDLKTALLAGDKPKVETLRGLKSAILNETIARGAKDSGLKDEEIQKVLSRESKKRSEAAELYKQGGNNERAEAELAEKAIIDAYLPQQMDESQISAAVDEEMAQMQPLTMADMGRIIGAVKAKLGVGADGATIARLVKEKLEQK
ncbi:MAG TPA: GatB/YqeY domain-containing protein [Candidatus Saccharimonadales bacterium]|nr:GatB/YqeY domain-containing protein [Candidatus Saccharimonadales bacterium]